jgi:hypothetical protein
MCVEGEYSFCRSALYLTDGSKNWPGTRSVKLLSANLVRQARRPSSQPHACRPAARPGRTVAPEPSLPSPRTHEVLRAHSGGGGSVQESPCRGAGPLPSALVLTASRRHRRESLRVPTHELSLPCGSATFPRSSLPRPLHLSRTHCSSVSTACATWVPSTPRAPDLPLRSQLEFRGRP